MSRIFRPYTQLQVGTEVHVANRRGLSNVACKPHSSSDMTARYALSGIQPRTSMHCIITAGQRHYRRMHACSCRATKGKQDSPAVLSTAQVESLQVGRKLTSIFSPIFRHRSFVDSGCRLRTRPAAVLCWEKAQHQHRIKAARLAYKQPTKLNNNNCQDELNASSFNYTRSVISGPAGHSTCRHQEREKVELSACM